MKITGIHNGLLIVLVALAPTASAKDERAAAIQTMLESEYKLTKTTDDKADIVKAGSVVVLHKDKVLMVPVSTAANPCMNTYRGGKITQSTACRVVSGVPGPFRAVTHADKVPTRNFVAGENFWVTKIDVRDTGKERGVVLDFFTDAISDVRYKGVLTIPFGAFTPTPDDALKVVAEVITVVPAENAKDGEKAQPTPAPTAPPPAEPVPPPIEPPPPPQPDPVVVSVGQTIDQVVAALGQPLGKFTAGTKEIYTYKSLKVTFVDGKVKDVE